ncbi:MAG: FAD-binding protein [Actinobacteria bacterium]|nr:FAD-binding protein [Actinomycetota bacterium]
MVDFYFEAETKEDLLQAKRASLLTNIPLLILGGGSNMAIIHKHLNVLAVKNRYMHLLISNNLVKIGSGYPTSRLVKATAEAGLEGLEYHYGLPGTIGGAIYMNSKWTKPLSYIGDHLLTATIIDKDGNLKKVDKDYFDFAYDFSNLQKSKEILLDATLR